jgi:hypothetical protein
MTKEKCSTKFCRGEVAVTYLGEPLCQVCYEKRCDLEDELTKEQEFLNQIVREFCP